MTTSNCTAGAVLAVLLTTGCGSRAVQAVDVASARWAAATGIVQERAPMIVEKYGPFKCGDKTTTGCYQRRPPVEFIAIDVQRPMTEIERTAAHEWGHRLGLDDGGNGIMGPKEATATSYCITQTELDTICLIYDCKWQQPECTQ